MAIYKSVRALERGLAVLRAANTVANPTVDSIARATELSWSTVFRLLETLEGAGYIKRSDNGHTYRPTLAARSLGEGFGREAWIAQFASEQVGALSRELIWPIDLMIFDNDAMLIVETTHRTSPLSIDRNMIGRRLPVLMTAAGRAYIGHVSEREQRNIIERLVHRKDAEGDLAKNKLKLRTLLKRTREQGYGVREGGLFPHTKSIAVPIIVDQRVMGCISVIWIASALSVSQGVARFAVPLKAAASRISGDLERT